ncbi:hypothetical protein GGI25_002103 [Coemansia spiralis]|uniref:ditrans,polycis-polyprenyl diphosphate synthase [(2E,6E)-farnesyldiphosphate specific] n=2 Tax=Coemansia TaxID=4863 RepID=A0A9W8GBA7_9FUNG|nr:hypothetical protein EDC05_001021 [Coemansia umbellata]KAJ2625584.1 hypothetical protein GGI26_000384 [Coemansia sp. RSA 1358]KAJ2678718.1 hypothetical protein GGI25_002103 [Coemansia spiralis]
MQAVLWLATAVLVAALTHIGGRRDKGEENPAKQSISQQLCDGACTVVLRAVHLALAVHRSFQGWVQSSLEQAGLDVQELLEGDDTEETTERRRHLAGFLASLPQRPEHLAVILPEGRESSIDDVEVLCAWGLLAKVPRLTIYTRDSGMQNSFDGSASRLRKSKMAARAFGSTPRISLDSTSRIEHLGVGTALADADADQQFDIRVSLWSRRNGYPALCTLAQELAAQMQCGPLESKDIGERLVSNRLAEPSGHCHPDLILLVDDLACLPDFPPWQLQSAEMVQIDANGRSLGDAFFKALVRYAKVERRWGK